MAQIKISKLEKLQVITLLWKQWEVINSVVGYRNLTGKKPAQTVKRYVDKSGKQQIVIAHTNYG